jgi:hypothetical protein
MKHQITRISPLQSAKIAALLCLILSLPALLYTMLPLLNAAGQRPRFMNASLLALPLIYAVTGFVCAGLAAGLYNLLARLVGGIEITLASLPVPAGPQPDRAEADTQPAPLASQTPVHQTPHPANLRAA